MLIINNRFLSLYDYNFLLVNQGLEKIFSVKPKTKQQRAVLIASEKLEHERKSHRKSLVSNLLRGQLTVPDFISYGSNKK